MTQVQLALSNVEKGLKEVAKACESFKRLEEKFSAHVDEISSRFDTLEAKLSDMRGVVAEVGSKRSRDGHAKNQLYTVMPEDEVRRVSDVQIPLIIMRHGYNARGRNLGVQERHKTAMDAVKHVLGAGREAQLAKLVFGTSSEAIPFKKEYEAKLVQKMHGHLTVSHLNCVCLH